MPQIDDYLTKQIYVDKNVVSNYSLHRYPSDDADYSATCKVTFRSLSRQFGLHVNAAKKYVGHSKCANTVL